MATEQEEAETLWDALADVMNDQFVQDATEAGVARWEFVLGITPKPTDSIADRKFRILTRIGEQLPFTLRSLEQQLEHLCGAGRYSVSINAGNYKLTIRVALVAQNNYNDVVALVNRIAPANLVIDLSLMFNRHEQWAGQTHAQMAAYTHDQIKSEVID